MSRKDHRREHLGREIGDNLRIMRLSPQIGHDRGEMAAIERRERITIAIGNGSEQFPI